MKKSSKSAKESKKSEKFLEHGTVVLNTVNHVTSVRNTIYSWYVPRYSRLQRHVMYFQEFVGREVGCVLKLLKTDSKLYLGLRSGRLAGKKARFYVTSETHVSLSTEAREVRAGLFAGEFTNELFEAPELHFLRDDRLAVSFRFVAEQLSDYQEREYDGVDVLADLEELCSDLKHMYLESLYPDFELHTEEYVFYAHKFILYARCPFFRNLFDRDSFVRAQAVDALPGILHEVLLFVYSGELKEDMDLACMLKVLELAHSLGVICLVEKCVECIEKRVDRTNFDEFRAFQEEKQYPALASVLEKVKAKLT